MPERDLTSSRAPRATRALARAPVVWSLIGANVVVYLLQKRVPDGMELRFALWPLRPAYGESNFHLWQIVTHAFLHSTQNIEHLLFNMLALWMFGTQIEYEIGSARFGACYFAAVITGALCQLWVPPLFGAPPAPTIGASGGVFGLLLAYAILFPRRKVVALLLPIPMPAWLFAMLYALVELFLGVTGTLSGVAHFAHLGGLVGSALVLLSWRGPRRSRR